MAAGITGTARGSAASPAEELIDDFNLCLDEGYGPPAMIESLKDDAYNLIARINGYIAYLNRIRQGD